MIQRCIDRTLEFIEMHRVFHPFVHTLLLMQMVADKFILMIATDRQDTLLLDIAKCLERIGPFANHISYTYFPIFTTRPELLS